ncbi:MAG: glycoside hydrolase family 97 protein, partial [Gemmatimonadetes bacterium]|nr:glycoside hydrolase family 97 protein [Gemmatimonadota bacterium]NIS01388.1 glycoside hydrolase family 97 protein [Gemmatimonadota bacterium]NIT66526.1 glycoside hydrolase family 97 protein [Gemmatimonadota bacterium]NIU52017.1 glycoside hydrolase family 97 protein [Gemmatimonadota bacterium]NIV23060.1 glycoside hydrolase family 97 protein [Gemmatimonadota bacterium]
GTPLYRVARDGRPVIRPSRLGFTFRNAPPLLDGLEVQEVGRRSFDQTWTQPWGETAEVLNHYNELRVTLAE